MHRFSALVLLLALPAAAPAQQPGCASGRCPARTTAASRPALPVNAVQLRATPAGYARPVYSAPLGTPAGDFLWRLNGYRASAGLPPVAFDAALSATSARNNAAQAIGGLGHHISGGWQVAGTGYATPAAAMTGWIGSPPHRAILLSHATRAGFDIRAGCATADFAR